MIYLATLLALLHETFLSSVVSSSSPYLPEPYLPDWLSSIQSKLVRTSIPYILSSLYRILIEMQKNSVIWLVGSSKKFQTLRTRTYHTSFWRGGSGDSKYIICFAKYLNFAKIKAIMYFEKFLNTFVKPRNLDFSRNKLYIWNLQITRFKMIYDMFVF